MRRFAALFLVVLPACLEVPKLDPGPYVIDDFEDGDLQPRAKSFDTWTCDTLSSDAVDGGAPGDSDAGALPSADGGASTTCKLEHGGDNHSAFALAADFDLPPDDMGQDPDARVFTNAIHTTVDFTRFKTFVFSSIVESSGDLPKGTQLSVELGCSKLQGPTSTSASSPVDFVAGSNWTAQRLPLSMFTLAGSSVNVSCLVEVDSIRFVIHPGRGGQSAVGTLHIDNVYLLQ